MITGISVDFVDKHENEKCSSTPFSSRTKTKHETIIRLSAYDIWWNMMTCLSTNQNEMEMSEPVDRTKMELLVLPFVHTHFANVIQSGTNEDALREMRGERTLLAFCTSLVSSLSVQCSYDNSKVGAVWQYQPTSKKEKGTGFSKPGMEVYNYKTISFCI